MEEDQPPKKWILFEPEKKEEKGTKNSGTKNMTNKKGLSRENTRIPAEEKMNSKDLQRFSAKYGQYFSTFFNWKTVQFTQRLWTM